VDLDADGNDDIISGSYWPGHVYVFKGEGAGKFAKGTELLEADGTKIIASKPWASEEDPDMDSLAAAPWMVDFDDDGDLDLLVGNISGRVMLVPNEGTAKEPKFSKERIALLGGTQPIRVGGGDAGPVTADWDGDGKWDLIVGSGDGAVVFFRNIGEKGKPVFAPGRDLIAKGARGYQPWGHGEEPTHQGGRTKVCVADYDGDGRLDLLVGDFATVKKPEPKLTAQQVAQRDKLRAERTKLSESMVALRQTHKDDPEAFEKAMQPLNESYSRIHRELAPLEEGQDYAGWVWLYKRKPPTETAQSSR
jgi:hypothetical protein